MFCDDLSFEEEDPSFKTVKSVLEGSIDSMGQQCLLYATSNRRHLLPESMVDNEGDRIIAQPEIHISEQVEEKLSLSDRFGLWISFYPINQEQYLEIVRHWVEYWASTYAVTLTAAEHASVAAEACRFALLRGHRSGRAAVRD